MQTEPERFSERTRQQVLLDPESELFLSAVSSWEIAIKFQVGKLELPSPPAEYVPSRLLSSGVIGLPIEHAHALQVASLPSHHRDPFDRLLVAQAQVESLPILTADSQIAAYDVTVLEP